MKFRVPVQSPLYFHVTPFVDILLVLLAFFVLTWSIREQESELGLSLPVAKHGQPERSAPLQVIVNVHADGRYVVNSRPLDAQELEAMLQRLAEQNPGQIIIVRADAATNYQNVLKVLDLCRGANISNIGFAAAEEKAE